MRTDTEEMGAVPILERLRRGLIDRRLVAAGHEIAAGSQRPPGIFDYLVNRSEISVRVIAYTRDDRGVDIWTVDAAEGTGDIIEVRRSCGRRDELVPQHMAPGSVLDLAASIAQDPSVLA